jgi:hypothetical protein
MQLFFLKSLKVDYHVWLWWEMMLKRQILVVSNMILSQEQVAHACLKQMVLGKLDICM